MAHPNLPANPNSLVVHPRNLQVYHGIHHGITNNPAYSRPLSRSEQARLSDSPLKRGLSDQEKIYLRAHAERRGAYDDTFAAADKAVQATFPQMPSVADEHLGHAQQTWAKKRSEAMQQQIVSPRFVNHLGNRIVQRTGQFLGDEAENFLISERQPYMYARIGALALESEFKGRTFHSWDLNDALESSLTRQESDQVRNILVQDGALLRDRETLKVNQAAVEWLSRTPVYTLPNLNHHRQY